jgi:hypothetical protein
LGDEIDVFRQPAFWEQAAGERGSTEEDHLFGLVCAERGEQVGDEVIAGDLSR